MKAKKAPLFRHAIISFFQQAKKEKRKSFRSPELINYIKKETGVKWFYPDSALRELRKMRSKKELNYAVGDKKTMEYFFAKVI